MLDQYSEWLEADGHGGYGSGTSILVPTRKYHGLLIVQHPTTGARTVLCNAVEAQLDVAGISYPLSSFLYGNSVLHPDGTRHISSFAADPWPTWRFNVGGVEVIYEILINHRTQQTVLSWTISNPEKSTLTVRPLCSCRGYHDLRRRQAAQLFHSEQRTDAVHFHGEQTPAWRMKSCAEFFDEPTWYYNFFYQTELDRGFPAHEDLFAPGKFVWRDTGHAFLILDGRQNSETDASNSAQLSPDYEARRLQQEERTRRSSLSWYRRSAEQFLISIEGRRSIVAGYPWFTDWGRDTFISLRGLCYTLNHLEFAGEILESWIDTISQGMVPNRFPDGASQPEYNSIDASLWYIIAAGEYLSKTTWCFPNAAMRSRKRRLREAIQDILRNYSAGTRYAIQADSDGLLAGGISGEQLTWMDARVNGEVITPRIGKPVEIQALWINALHIGAKISADWNLLLEKATANFRAKFWEQERGYLFDVIDCDHQPGSIDRSVRPNQLLACGGLPYRLLERHRAQRVLKVVQDELMTPMGPRSLSSWDTRYQGRYVGSMAERDRAYHQGTVWPWLIGAFVDAWIWVTGNDRRAKEEAFRRFVAPIREQSKVFGIHHIAEIAEGDPPHRPDGCPFQAWSLGETIRAAHRCDKLDEL